MLVEGPMVSFLHYHAMHGIVTSGGFLFGFFLSCSFFFFFFFQAEDGIRDRTVTGVQTCALPILIEVFRAHDIGYFFYNGGGDSADTCLKVSQLGDKLGYPIQAIHVPKTMDNDLRSEERRVGKECRTGWWREVCRKKHKENEMVVE